MDALDVRAEGAARAAVERGARFLVARQGNDGLWRDFETPAGEASLWPTACIAMALRHVEIGHDALERATRALVAAQRDDGGWGYNEDVPSDADSTAWALLVVAGTSQHESSCRRAVACLVRHQRDDGGIATYAEPSPIRRFMAMGRWMPFWGWCRPHIEVTAVAARALGNAPGGAGLAAADAAWRFVRSRQRAAGDWASYWWTSSRYATAQSVALAAARGDRAVVDRAAMWVLRSCTDATQGAFDCAMSLSILATAGAEVRVSDRAVEDLIARQEADGGWPTEPILRIPVPAERDPDREDRRRLVRFGGGMVVRDQHRLFTSAACITALGSSS